MHAHSRQMIGPIREELLLLDLLKAVASNSYSHGGLPVNRYIASTSSWDRSSSCHLNTAASQLSEGCTGFLAMNEKFVATAMGSLAKLFPRDLVRISRDRPQSMTSTPRLAALLFTMQEV